VKLKFEKIFRLHGFALLALLFWAVWASAQPATNSAAPPASAGSETNRVGALAKKLGSLEQQLEEHDLIFHLDSIEFLREHTFMDQPLWKYLASLIYILLAFYISKLLDLLVNSWLKRWAAKTATTLDDWIIGLLHGPVKVITFVVFLNIGLNVFRWPEAVEKYLTKGMILFVAFSVTYLALKLVDLMMRLWRERTVAGTDKAFDEQLFPVIRKSLKAFVVVVGVLVTSQNLGINITGALASLSVGALAVGLAAQDTLANLFGAIAVYIDKPFRIGDRILLDSVDGQVESIGLRSTRVRSTDGNHVTIPNKTVGNATITNITRRLSIKTELNLGLTYDTPAAQVQRALQILDEVYRANPMTADLLISFNKFADSALNLQVVHWWNSTDQKSYLAGMQEFNLKIKERFDAEGIQFAFPTRTIYVKPEPAGRPVPK